MANMLDETSVADVNPAGRDVNVIHKQIPVTVGFGSTLFEILLWVLGIIPGVVFLFKKIKAKNYFQQLEQKIQHAASEIDNYLEQRVVILKNCARLLDKAIDLDKSTFEKIAMYRGGGVASGEERNKIAGELDNISRSVSIAFENYPDLEAHDEIQEAMKQNTYLQREITAARSAYNDVVNAWNRDIFCWPTKQIVAARSGYTTRIPFATTSEIKEQARDVFF